MSIATNDFRDGAASGAALVAARARSMSSWGIPLTTDLIDKVAEGVVHEYGGAVSVPLERGGA